MWEGVCLSRGGVRVSRPYIFSIATVYCGVNLPFARIMNRWIELDKGSYSIMHASYSGSDVGLCCCGVL